MLKLSKRVMPAAVANGLRYAAGWWVGNRRQLDGCLFDLDMPQVSRKAKSSFLFDRYEAGLRKAVIECLPRDLPVIELGAGLGVVSCITNRLLDKPHQHVVVEANPAMIPAIQRQRTMNECQFDILNAAIVYGWGDVNLKTEDSFLSTQVIKTTTLKHVTHALGVARTFSLICDIEGAEIELVKNEADVLRGYVNTLILETHPHIVGESAAKEMFVRLGSIGFCKRRWVSKDVVVLRKG